MFAAEPSRIPQECLTGESGSILRQLEQLTDHVNDLQHDLSNFSDEAFEWVRDQRYMLVFLLQWQPAESQMRKKLSEFLLGDPVPLTHQAQLALAGIPCHCL
jgi:hypothetical protein